jgi:hypothetical protein
MGLLGSMAVVSGLWHRFTTLYRSLKSKEVLNFTCLHCLVIIIVISQAISI